jgi:hypothetical protein
LRVESWELGVGSWELLYPYSLSPIPYPLVQEVSDTCKYHYNS